MCKSSNLSARCAWALVDDPASVDYHDREWGVPVHDDRVLFECLMLESAQAGLSWVTILHKRGGYRAAFENFAPARVALFDQRRIQQLLADATIVRHRGKIEAAVSNARVFMEVQARYGSFDAFLWRYVDGQPVQNAWSTPAAVPSSTVLSTQIAKDLKRLGFKFIGPTICYSFMQATGVVNDHLTSCFRHLDLRRSRG